MEVAAMYPLIIAALLLILLGSWLLSVRHKLSVLDENAGSAMSQIGVQLASRFDALNMLMLFSGDAFGCFGALNGGIIDTEINLGLTCTTTLGCNDKHTIGCTRTIHNHYIKTAERP